jgi:hypothetical protein
MKRHVMMSLIAGSVVACVSFVVARADESNKSDTPKIPWKITGELEESCSCNGPCPCWFATLPSRMQCNGDQVIFIKSGHYGKTRLDGLAMAQFVQSPEGQTMKDSFGNWNFDHVYIDERANDEQRKALQEIAAHVFPPSAKKREFHFVPVERRIEGKEHVITIGKVGNFSGHLLEGGYNGAPKIINPPLADPTHRQFEQGVAAKLVYTDAGQQWNYENSNYMFNRFSVDSVEYEKHETAFAKKMEAAKKSAK